FVVFFQAEDGIRAFLVTGVQTCALPISSEAVVQPHAGEGIGVLGAVRDVGVVLDGVGHLETQAGVDLHPQAKHRLAVGVVGTGLHAQVIFKTGGLGEFPVILARQQQHRLVEGLPGVLLLAAAARGRGPRVAQRPLGGDHMAADPADQRCLVFAAAATVVLVATVAKGVIAVVEGILGLAPKDIGLGTAAVILGGIHGLELTAVG